VIASRISSKAHAFLPVTSLDIVLDSTLEEAKEKLFRTRFCILATKPVNIIGNDFKPEDVISIIKAQNKKTEAFRDITLKSSALKKDERYVIALLLYVQDFSLQTSNQIAKVMLVESDDKPSEFFRGIKIEDILKKKEA
jgi:hypothetical protein